MGRILFALSIVLLGAFGIGFRDFAFVWQLVPRTIAGHDVLTAVCGAILLAGGGALLMPRTARPAALILAGFLFFALLLLRVPPVVARPLVEANWYGLGETLTLAAGAWTIFSGLKTGSGEAFTGLGNVCAGQILFALALFPLGLAHFFYVGQTAPLIPSWLPWHVPLAYFTGTAHIAAGAGILSGILFSVTLARLAATLEAAMVSLFTLLVWVPTLAATPASLFDWTELLVSMAISGAAWAVAELFRASPG